jgi:SAM-dependent methyltransferase
MADLPLTLLPPLDDTLSRALDIEGKITRALQALGPIAGCDVVLVDGGPRETRRLADAGAQLTSIETAFGAEAKGLRASWPVADGTADAVVAEWSGFRGKLPEELAEADRVLKPGGRLLVVEDYGRDDVSRLRGENPDHRLWSRRDGPFLSVGFRIRVIHCFWTFDSVETAGSFLADVFGAAGKEFAATLTRPRLSYNVAIYHRTRGEVGASA